MPDAIAHPQTLKGVSNKAQRPRSLWAGYCWAAASIGQGLGRSIGQRIRQDHTVETTRLSPMRSNQDEPGAGCRTPK
jgi:hypothetical protein